MLTLSGPQSEFYWEIYEIYEARERADKKLILINLEIFRILKKPKKVFIIVTLS